MRRTTARGKGFTIAGTLMLVLGLVGGLASPALAASGDLDPSFGGDGKVTTPIPRGNPESNAIVVQLDGKVVVAGVAHAGPHLNSRFAVARYNVDGSLDPSFGSDGLVTTDLTPYGDHAYGLTIQPDGKLVASGVAGKGPVATTNSEFGVVRYNTDGSRDATFGTDGIVLTDISRRDDYGNAPAVQADGKIVVAGLSNCCGNARFAVARYDTDGTLDTTFGAGGVTKADFTGLPDFVFSSAVQADGKILAVGVANVGSDNVDFAVARFNTDGTLDTTFGGSGRVTTDLSGKTDWAGDVAVQADGKIVVAGSSSFGSSHGRYALVRYNTDGTLDTTFGGSGKVTTNLTPQADWGRAVAIQTDGKIVVAGGTALEASGDFGLARYMSDGTLDPSFGTDGVVTTDFTPRLDVGSGLAIGPDGKLVVAGVSGVGGTARIAVARYSAS